MDLPVVTLHRGRARPFWHGNPVVFSGAVASVEGDPGAGSLVEVRDVEGHPIGDGFYNPASSYRVRMVRLARDALLPRDPAGIVRHRIERAAATRRAFNLPSADTNAWRMVNSEGDYLSGLTVDVYGSTAVLQASALWVERHRAAVEESIRAVSGASTRILYRVSNTVRREEGMTEAEPVQEEPPAEVRESGLAFGVDLVRGQKTGLYLDQRENRLLVRGFAKGRRVLDAFCFTGGFALNAVLGGAVSVEGVDTSTPAILAARENAARNGLADMRFDTADAVEVLSGGGTWDLIVCDPPKLAGSRQDLDAALTRYLRINQAAIRALAPDGILVTCSCSGVLQRDAFLALVRDAAHLSGRHLCMTHVRGAGPDHVLNPAYPEGEYLKCVVAAVV